MMNEPPTYLDSLTRLSYEIPPDLQAALYALAGECLFEKGTCVITARSYFPDSIFYNPCEEFAISSLSDSLNAPHIPIPNPDYALQYLAPPYTGNPTLVMSFEAPEQYATASLLTYTLRFKLEEQLCSAPNLANYSISGFFKGERPCFIDTLEDAEALRRLYDFNNLKMPNNISDITNDSNCCTKTGIDIALIGPCALSDSLGTLVIRLDSSIIDTITHRLILISVVNNVLGRDTVELTDNTTFIDSLVYGTYGVIVQNTSTAVSFFETFVIQNRTIDADVQALIAYTCEGTQVSLTAQSGNVAAGALTYRWTTDGDTTLLSDETSLSATIADTTTFRVMISSEYGCRDTILTTIDATPPPVVTLNMPATVCNNQLQPVSVSPAGGVLRVDDVITSYADSLFNPAGLSPGTHKVSYTYTTTTGAGCSYSDTVSIDVNTTYCVCPCVSQGPQQITVPDSIDTDAGLAAFFNSKIIENTCLVIQNNIQVNDTLAFINCNIILKGGVEINISQTGILLSANTVWMGCDTLWKGIVNNGRMLAAGSVFRDAFKAITLQRHDTYTPITVLHTGVTFSNNYIGLTNSPEGRNHLILFLYGTVFDGGPLLPDYAGQTLQGNPSGGIAGIKILKGFNLTVPATVTFRNLYNGIITSKARLTVDRALFENIQFNEANIWYAGEADSLEAISSAAINAGRGSVITVLGRMAQDTASVMFKGCKVGISALGSRLAVSNARFDGTATSSSWVGILVKESYRDEGFTIRKNRIRANYAGVLIDHCEPMYPNSAFVSNNNISIVDSFPAVLPGIPYMRMGIWVVNQFSGNNIRIDSNTVNLRTAKRSNGISILNAPQTFVAFNDVIRYGNSQGNGFDITNSSVALLGCNRSRGTAAALQGQLNYGFNIRNSVSPILLLNAADSTRYGFRFEQTNTNTQFMLNDMAYHPDTALVIARNATISPQPHRYNRWSHSAGLDAVNHGSPENIFYVYENLFGTEYYASHPNPVIPCLADVFFRCVDGSGSTPAYYCPAYGSTVQAMTLIDTTAEYEKTLNLAALLAPDTALFAMYDAQTRYSLKRSIDRLLHTYNQALPDTGTLAAFKADIAGSNIPALNTIDRLLEKHEPDSAANSLMNTYWAGLKGYYTALQAIDSTLATVAQPVGDEQWAAEQALAAPDEQVLADRQELMANISAQEALISGLEAGQQAAMQALLDSAAALNAALVPATDWEENEQAVNAIYLRFAAGHFNFNAGQKDTLEAIAALCPLLGPDAVYKARSLVYTYKPTAVFDDATHCPQGYAARMAGQGNAGTAQAPETVKLYPNPNSGILNVSILSKLGDKFLINIYNSTGRRVYSIETADKELKINLAAIGISDGLYLLEAVDVESNYLIKSKFIYEKR